LISKAIRVFGKGKVTLTNVKLKGKLATKIGLKWKTKNIPPKKATRFKHTLALELIQILPARLLMKNPT